tara:strand:- start:7141 stop:7308 length:168 start_codon:yes stop_codon:yes gene_type:complete
MIKTLLQARANNIIKSMEALEGRDDDEANHNFDTLYRMGMSLNMMALYVLEIELD